MLNIFLQVLITEFGHLGANRYLAPNLKKSFKYDHLRKEALDIDSCAVDEASEPWRAALDKAVAAHVKEHFADGFHTVSITHPGPHSWRCLAWNSVLTVLCKACRLKGS